MNALLRGFAYLPFEQQPTRHRIPYKLPPAIVPEIELPSFFLFSKPASPATPQEIAKQFGGRSHLPAHFWMPGPSGLSLRVICAKDLVQALGRDVHVERMTVEPAFDADVAHKITQDAPPWLDEWRSWRDGIAIIGRLEN